MNGASLNDARYPMGIISFHGKPGISIPTVCVHHPHGIDSWFAGVRYSQVNAKRIPL